MSITNFGYSILHNLDYSPWGQGLLLWKIDTQEIWFQSYNGSLKLIAPSGANGEFYFQISPPVAPIPGAVWVHANTGIFYVYVNDGNSSQWMQPY